MQVGNRRVRRRNRWFDFLSLLRSQWLCFRIPPCINWIGASRETTIVISSDRSTYCLLSGFSSISICFFLWSVILFRWIKAYSSTFFSFVDWLSCVSWLKAYSISYIFAGFLDWLIDVLNCIDLVLINFKKLKREGSKLEKLSSCWTGPVLPDFPKWDWSDKCLLSRWQLSEF